MNQPSDFEAHKMQHRQQLEERIKI
jgi:hypothetical protein